MLIPKNSFNDKMPVYVEPIHSKTSFFPLLEKIKAIFKTITTFFETKTTEKEKSKPETFNLFKVLTSLLPSQQLFDKIIKVYSDIFSKTTPTKLEIKLAMEEDLKINRQDLLLLQETAFELDSFVLNHPDLKEICEECYLGSVIKMNSFYTTPLDKELSESCRVSCQVMIEEHNIKARINFVLTEPTIYNWLRKYEGSDMPDLLKSCLITTH